MRSEAWRQSSKEKRKLNPRINCIHHLYFGIKALAFYPIEKHGEILKDEFRIGFWILPARLSRTNL